MRRGEVWWAAPRLPGGSGKRRPFLVVSSDVFNANPRYPKVMVVHLTTVPRSAIPDWEVGLARGVAKLPASSTAKCGEVYTLTKDQLEQLVGTLPADHMARVDRALAVALALPVVRER